MFSKGMFTLICLKISNILSNWAELRLDLSLLGNGATILVFDPSDSSKGLARWLGVILGSGTLDSLGWPCSISYSESGSSNSSSSDEPTIGNCVLIPID